MRNYELITRARSEKKARRKDNSNFIRKVSGRPKLASIAKLKAKLWDLNTLVVKKRDGHMCLSCLVEEGYCQNHIIPQCEAPALKYDLLNIFWGGRACNTSEKYQRAQWSKQVFPARFGMEYYSDLWARAKVAVSQLRRGELMGMIGEREAMLRGEIAIPGPKRMAL